MTHNDTEANNIDPETGQNWIESTDIDTHIDESSPGSKAERLKTAQNDTEIRVSRLTHRQQFALQIMVETPSISEAARQSKIARKTLYRWLEDDDFRQELSRLHQEAAELAREETQSLMLQGVAVLAASMKDPDKAIRLRAARYALTFAHQVAEAEKVKQELHDLQESIPLWVAHNSK